VDATRGSDRRETIGQRLRRLRLARGLSQRELAGPGVSYAYISRIEAGARRPSVKALRTLSPKLAVSVVMAERYGWGRVRAPTREDVVQWSHCRFQS
jgi:transcriptional regulator with XRE-family HTH domain